MNILKRKHFLEKILCSSKQDYEISKGMTIFIYTRTVHFFTGKDSGVKDTKVTLIDCIPIIWVYDNHSKTHEKEFLQGNSSGWRSLAEESSQILPFYRQALVQKRWKTTQQWKS